MTESLTCQVKGCPEPRSVPYLTSDTPELHGPHTALICEFHKLAFDNGDDFDIDGKTDELIVRSRLIGYVVGHNIRGKTVEFIYGRDGVEDGRTPPLRVDAAVLEEIINRLDQ